MADMRALANVWDCQVEHRADVFYLSNLISFNLVKELQKQYVKMLLLRKTKANIWKTTK